MFARMFKHWALRAYYSSVTVVSMSPYSCVLERIRLPYADLKDIKKLVKELEKWKSTRIIIGNNMYCPFNK
jgi:hypothetical protein